MTTVIRATEGDFDDVVRILTAYFDAIELPSAARDRPDEISAYLREPRGMWLARDAVHVVGIIGLRPLVTIAGACEIKRLYVDPAHRGRGIADALLDALESEAVACGYTFAYLDTCANFHAAIAFYQRHGYETCERYNDNMGTMKFMRLRLPIATPKRA